LLLPDAFFVDLQKKHSRYSEVVTGRIENLFAFNQPFGDPVNRFVGMIFREGAAAPFKEPHQFAASLKILLASALPISSQGGQQSIKRFLR